MPVALVTGATGQDGSYLCQTLTAQGWEVHALVRPMDDGARDVDLDQLLAWCPTVQPHQGDLGDSRAVMALIGRLAPDEIYNLAGISSVAYSWNEPVITGIISGVSVAAVLHGAWLSQESTGTPVHVLQASSAEIFGSAAVVPQVETTAIHPRTPYGAAKAYGHHMVDIYRGRGLHATAAILYNHESPRRPETFVTRKITMAAAKIAAGQLDALSLGALDVRRDWGWAPDYVAAMILANRHPHATDFVIATGQSHTVADFVAAAFARAGVDDWQDRVSVDPAFIRPAETAEQLGDASKAREQLGWEPSKSFVEVVHAMVDHDIELVSSR